ncbi:chemotaxis response regulator protein-glutamate methylesterase [Aliiglaciecola sp. CAU 1673]|uniref:protein-glutamate methylesterase/protein-glutamine glutaminase n=1 Tax=Aliiglaciecola sp. CAU 1673 TaxID=3032595 RepID=UPI0023DBED44|nr:chemotaxis response regulator protein-glutamate methylesterase [Aliiglaciecola sp. CAU 1673]MDF2177476.1 chemotaxis response regulator protein-glutamate methylesterase [Aliiglaciecola sp. CAU 1673]
MRYKVLVVDDSTFFRRRVTELLNQDPGLEVVGQARNGQEAIEQAAKLQPDVITMDVEMPVMDGISAVRRIMAERPTPVLMFSSLTHDGAQATLDALDAGALDFLPKRFEDIAKERNEAISLLQQRVKALARRRAFLRPTPRPEFIRSETLRPEPSKPQPLRPDSPRTGSLLGQAREAAGRVGGASVTRLTRSSGKRYGALAIGSSTGGPVALQNILTQLPENFPYPIFLVQHMPGTFTSAFAARLNNLCKITVKEASNGDLVKPGCAYLAPGGKQMLLEGSAGQSRIRILDDSSLENITYKPSVDITFESIAKVYSGNVLGVILTGMGADGREGCRCLKQHGALIWAQDEKSCVVYGMPQAVAAAGISSASMALDDISANILMEMSA